MAVNAVGSSNSLFGTSYGISVKPMEDQFMKILLTQLRYQDPMEPIKERDFFAQMAQFSTAAQVENLNTNLAVAMSMLYDLNCDNAFLGAAQLIGRPFQALVDGTHVEGVIESVILGDEGILVKSGSWEIPVSYLVSVGG